MSTPSSPEGGWGRPSGDGDQHGHEQQHEQDGRARAGSEGAAGWVDPAAGRDPWASPPAAPAPQPQPGQQGQSSQQTQPFQSAPDAWWQPTGAGRDAFPPQAPDGPQATTQQGWYGEAPRPSRSGSPARWIGAGSLVLVLGVVGGFAGGLLQDELSDGGDYSSVALPAPSAGSTDRPSGSVAGIAATALPSVVALQVEGQEGLGTGSGFVLDTAGDGGTFILTNNHVIAGAYDDGVVVVFEDGQQVAGEVVGADVSYDLAVVRVEREGLQALPFGDSEAVVVGDPVVAVGAPLGLQGTVTEGIVSALNRPVSAGESADSASYIQAIQTDAAINPGNSGGPLLNAAGEVIGINSAIATAPGNLGQTSGSIGLGFSIPSEQARRTAEQLIRTGQAVHPVIKVSLDNSYTGQGVQIVDEAGAVVAGGPGDRAGLQPGDVVLAIDDRPVTEPVELIVDIRAREPGETVTLTVRRGGQDSQVPVTLEADG